MELELGYDFYKRKFKRVNINYTKTNRVLKQNMIYNIMQGTKT